MPQCGICGEELQLQDATDGSYVCNICYEHLQFCASLDLLIFFAKMPEKEGVDVEACVETHFEQHLALPSH